MNGMISLSPEKIIRVGGLLALGGIIFAESGLLIGFFLPGDSLLFTGGFLASQNLVNIHLLVAVTFVSAVAGDSVGYAIGNRVGPRLLKRSDGKLFKKRYISEAQVFYEKHGKKTIVIARFVPIVRTFAPIVAGLGDMNYSTFLTYNLVGGALWTVGLSYGGYFLGRSVPWVSKYLEVAIIGVVFISLLPALIHLLRQPSARKKITQSIKNFLPRK